MKKYYSLKDVNNNIDNKINTLFNIINKQSSSLKDYFRNISRNKNNNKTNNIKVLNKSDSFNICDKGEKKNKTNVKFFPVINNFPYGQQTFSPQGTTFYPNLNNSTIVKKMDNSKNIPKNNNDRSIINIQKSFLNKSYNEKVKENEEKKKFYKIRKKCS